MLIEALFLLQAQYAPLDHHSEKVAAAMGLCYLQKVRHSVG